jgi:cytochrome c biogenesis protein CcmG/thiol:disulfide interchange protein DsbE
MTGPRLGFALAAALCLVACGERAAPPIEAGVAAPDFALPRLGGGGELALRDLRGKVVLVNFWATWCAPCEKEMPAMQRLYARLAPLGLELVAISEDDGPEVVERFRERLGLSFPIALDPKHEAAARYQSYRYPESFLIDRDGVLVARYIGERDWDAPEYVSRIERLLTPMAPR